MTVRSKPRMTVDETGAIARRLLKGGQFDLTPPALTVRLRELLPEVSDLWVGR